MQIAVFKPKTNPRFTWDMIVVIAIIYTAVMLPLQVSLRFQQSPLLKGLDILFMVIFVLDLPVNFNTAVFRNNRFETDRKYIAKRYLRGWFFIDFISAPFYLIILLFTSVSVETLILLKLFRLFKLVRLLKLTHVTRFLHKLLGIDFLDPGYMKLFTFVLVVCLVSHLIACGWLLLGGAPPLDDPLARYTVALYWSITTLSTVGYGDQVARTGSQMVYAMIVMYLGVGLYAFIIGNIANLLANLNMAKVRFRNKLESVNAFLKYKRIPKPLQKKINDYYEFVWEHKLSVDEQTILEELPHSYQRELSVILKKDFIHKIPLFKSASDELIEDIIIYLRTEIFAPNDFVFQFGDSDAKGLYFINSGSVDVISEDGKVLATLSDGSFFGEMALMGDGKRSAGIRCVSYCEMFNLSREDFQVILKKHQKFKKEIEKTAKERSKKS